MIKHKTFGTIYRANQENAKLKRRIRTLEHDLTQAHSLLLPDIERVYRTALRWKRAKDNLAEARPGEIERHLLSQRLFRITDALYDVCARAEKRAKKGAKR